MNGKVIVDLTRAEFEMLYAVAQREIRTPREQARRIILDALHIVEHIPTSKTEAANAKTNTKQPA